MFLVSIATKTFNQKCFKWWCECGFQVFLEPFSLVLGQSKSKRVLISLAQSDTRHLNCLHRLGIVLGITDWVKDYQKKLEPAQSPHTAPVEQAKVRIHLETTLWMSHFIYSCKDILYFLFFFPVKLDRFSEQQPLGSECSRRFWGRHGRQFCLHPTRHELTPGYL